MRRSLGRLEQPAATAYRRAFFNVDHFADRLLSVVPHASRILEIGCGDGDVATALTRTYASADYLGIDIAPEPGRRYIDGNARPGARVEFASRTSADLRAEQRPSFDLVVVVDVLHHIPDDAARVDVLADAEAMLASGGTLAVKEWEVQPTLAYQAGWAADRYVSGDAQVRYMPRGGLLGLVETAAPKLRHDHTLTVRPWKCNVLHVFRKV